MIQDTRDGRTTVDEILFDCRTLQHPARASDRHADFDGALLSMIRHDDWPGVRPRLVGLVDHAAGPLREHQRLFFDEVTSGRHRTGQLSRCFISSAPMAHDPVWALPILLDPRIFKVAAVHELLSLGPSADPVSDVERQADHLTCFAWLGRYDLFAVASQHVKAELEQLRAIDPSRIVIAGRVLRSGPRLRSTVSLVPLANRRHVTVVVEESGQEELESVLTAHARSQTRRRFPVVMLGHCPPELRGQLRTHYGREGGAQDDLMFIDRLPDGDVGDPRRDALLTVVPSWGSEALVSAALESAALGTPTVAPAAGAHAIQVGVPAFSYPSGDCDALAQIIDAVADGAALWEEARASGMVEGRRHSAAGAARRLLDALAERVTRRPPAPAVRRGLRPRLAMITPLPPATAAAAARSATTIEALSRHVDIQAFSDTPAAIPGSSARPIAPVRDLELGLHGFDASLCVLGNSRQHAAVFEHLLANGGAALTHDAQLATFYAGTLGIDRALKVGRAERGGEVTRDEVAEWAREPRDLPVLFMSEVARMAAPLLVTSEVACREMARLYGIVPRRLPLLQHRTFDHGLLAWETRRIRREALGWDRNDVVMCAFDLGFAAAAVVLWTLRLLHDWRVDARLALRAPNDEGDRARIDELARDLDLDRWITPIADGLSGRTYGDHLVAADMAIEVGTHPLSGPSATMMDCIAASLPTIADDHAADTAAAPAFVRRVPDALSPVLIAEAALDIIASGQHRERPVDEARAYAVAHSPDLYALALAEALELGHS